MTGFPCVTAHTKPQALSFAPPLPIANIIFGFTAATTQQGAHAAISVVAISCRLLHSQVSWKLFYSITRYQRHRIANMDGRLFLHHYSHEIAGSLHSSLLRDNNGMFHNDDPGQERELLCTRTI
jgi:hypothetical protein